MSNGTKFVWVVIVLVSLIVGGYYVYNISVKAKAEKDLAVAKGVLDAMVVSLEGNSFLHPSDLYQGPIKYLTAALKAMNTRTFIGMSVFSQKNREGIYDEFMQRIFAFRQALISYSPSISLGNREKEDVVQKIASSVEILFTKNLVTDAKDLKTDPIYLKWSNQDRQKLIIQNNELPNEVVGEEIPEKSEAQSQYAQLDVVDGKNMDGEEIGIAPEKKEPVGEKVRTQVDYADLKELVGEIIEVQKKNGTVQDGKLIEVDELSLTLNILLEGGHFSLKILKADIDKLEKITFKKAVATETEE